MCRSRWIHAQRSTASKIWLAYRPWEWPQASESDGLPSPALVECMLGPKYLISSSEAMRPWPSCHALYDLARINRFNFYDFTIFYREALLGSFEWETSSCVFCFVGIGVVEFQPMFWILRNVLTTVVWNMGIYLHWMISDDFMQFTSFGWILQLGLGVDSYDWIDTCRYKL